MYIRRGIPFSQEGYKFPQNFFKFSVHSDSLTLILLSEVVTPTLLPHLLMVCQSSTSYWPLHNTMVPMKQQYSKRSVC